MIRIIGGESKGRKISFRKASSKKNISSLRPTSAKVRKAIFDIIGVGIKDSKFLDLYAGTGAIGIEALSRGASEVVFVEEDPIRVNAIKDVLLSLGFSDRSKVIRDKVISFVRKSKKDHAFDIVFADPPYDSKDLEKLIPLLDDSDLIMDGGILIIEHSSKRSFFLPEIKELEFRRSYKYGDTMLSVYIKSLRRY
ncbi:MAG: 16S rRNA (guanine(966)-N(2))-methyltransferase RsmD [Thermodesulfovibrionales bacterium]|nr:16S rRNA (guanine(966)-N(2))-methyltransferase RsmD [Thermodesulfovibrionales bacterium]